MKKKFNLKNKKNGYLLITVVVLLIAVIAVSIFKKESESGTSLTGKKTTTTTTTKKLKIVNLDSKSRPYAVMINNIGVARPLQSGLQDAYIIYEMIVEGGLTRYMALFLDQSTERIGSIRSARHYYLDYALENDAIYVHHGRSPQAYEDFSKLGVDRIEVDNTTTGWRDKTLNVASEHTLFTSIEKLNKGIGSKRTERKKDLLLNYSVDSLDLTKYEGQTQANSVSIKYSSSMTSSYKYDPETKLYIRSVNGKEHTDYVTKQTYKFKNIITYQVKNYTLDDPENKGRQGLENIGSGTGYYISEGIAVPITWEKKSRESQTIYKFKNGEELVVNDGNTFIQIQPKGQTLTIE
ncbi:MAG: DUF3048 domain-containing protein [bacterium]|nr:DUF3048 domain-containing protein [bacterium]